MSKNGKNPKSFKGKQALAIHHLTSGRSMTETAKLLGVTRQTIGNWMRDPNFNKSLHDLQSKRIDELTMMHQSQDLPVFEFFKSIMQDPAVPYRDRIRAAIEIRNESHNLKMIRDFDLRLRELQEVVEEQERK
jgi:hypothetical protein